MAVPPKLRVLILAAVEAELSDMSGFCVGVGPIRSAVGATRLILGHRPQAVVMIGTAGALSPDLPVPSVVVARRLGWAHSGSILGAGYVPLPPADLEADASLVAAMNLPQADVVTVGAITTDPQVADALRVRWQVEHMEAYSVALAAAELGVPFAAVLGLSNRVGPNAHEEWKANRQTAESAARDAVSRWLAG
jgi:nucleoside phosphorylase